MRLLLSWKVLPWERKHLNLKSRTFPSSVPAYASPECNDTRGGLLVFGVQRCNLAECTKTRNVSVAQKSNVSMKSCQAPTGQTAGAGGRSRQKAIYHFPFVISHFLFGLQVERSAVD